MLRLQAIFPYLVIFLVCICLVVVLHATRPTTDGRVDRIVQKDFKQFPAVPKRGDSNEVPGAKRDAAKEEKPPDDPQFLEQLQVGKSTFYKPINLYQPPGDEKFTIVIQSFNRTDLLMRLLNHYSAVHGVDRIIVVWNTIGEEPPYDWWEKLKPHPTEVVFLVQEVNNVRNRLQRFPEIRTEGVLMLDDDHLYATRDVEFAFRVWKQSRDKLVGFVARKHVEVSNGIFLYGDFDLNSGTPLGGYVYSFVLIGATFLHRDYLEMFNNEEEVPYGVHQLIDEKENCDDLAMNFVVGRHLAKKSGSLQCVGLYVYPTVTKNIEKDALSGYAGKWKNPEHFAVRSHCINALAKLYSGIPLQYCDMVLSSYFDFTRLKQC